MKKYIEIGDTFIYENNEYKAIELYVGSGCSACVFCAFYYTLYVNDECEKIDEIPECLEYERHDGKEIYFVPIDIEGIEKYKISSGGLYPNDLG